MALAEVGAPAEALPQQFTLPNKAAGFIPLGQSDNHSQRQAHATLPSRQGEVPANTQANTLACSSNLSALIFFLFTFNLIQCGSTSMLRKMFCVGNARSALASHMLLKMTVCQGHARQRTARPDRRFRGLDFWAAGQGASQKHRK